VSRLNGHIHLLRGNHDRWRSNEWFMEAGFAAIYPEPFAIGNITVQRG